MSALVLVLAVIAQVPNPAPLAPVEQAQLAPTRLVYVPGVLAPKCPSQADVQQRVVQSLGADPFVEPAQQIALVVVEAEPGAAEGAPPVRARAELLDIEYTSLGERVIENGADATGERRESCDELVAAAALALAIALDPTRALTPPPEEPLPPPPEAPLAPLAPERGAAGSGPVIVRDEIDDLDPLKDILPAGTTLTLGVGGQAGLLLTPGFQRGAHVSAAWRGSWWGLGAELRNDIPAFDPSGATLLTVLPCAHLGFLSVRDGDAIAEEDADGPIFSGDELALRACTATTAGVAWSLEPSSPGGGPYVGLGARIGLEWVMRDASAVGVWAQLEAAVVRPVYGVVSVANPDRPEAAPVNLAFGATFDLGWPL